MSFVADLRVIAKTLLAVGPGRQLHLEKLIYLRSLASSDSP